MIAEKPDANILKLRYLLWDSDDQLVHEANVFVGRDIVGELAGALRKTDISMINSTVLIQLLNKVFRVGTLLLGRTRLAVGQSNRP